MRFKYMVQGQGMWTSLYINSEDALWLRFTDSIQVRLVRLRIKGKA